MKDGPNRTDHTVTTAMEMDNEMNTKTSGNEEKILWKCECGWEKVTTFRGLRIRQGKRKCGQKGQQQPCTPLAEKTRGTESQVDVAKGKDGVYKESPLVEGEPPHENQEPAATNSHKTETKAEAKEPTRRGKLKWPKANEAEVWKTLDIDLVKTLEGSLRGGVESKLNQIGDILYQACKNRFGEVTHNQRSAQREKSRREVEIDHLVRRRRKLRKNWRKATLAAKEGLKALWEEVRKRLSRLRRAEHIRKRSKRKQKERASFFKDPFKHARQLLEEEKSGRLETTREHLEQHIRTQCSDPVRNVPLGTPGSVPKPAPPTAAFNIMPPQAQ